MFQHGIAILYDFLIGASVSATLLAPFGRKALNYFFPSATATLFNRSTTALLALGGGILGAKFNITKAPDLWLDMVLAGNPFAIVTVGSIMMLCMIAIVRFIAGGRTS
ncbi:MAG: hypothetical protein KGZ48_11315 [Dethiobacter sp.]|nr:hypothetical protein [Dethiobacter sp.]MBS4055537.1 hypothetical protein [Thermaerobacter sp.]